MVLAFMVLFTLFGFGDCHPTTPAGGLVRASIDTSVGVLLDDLPAGPVRESVASAVISESDDFWLDRARAQLNLGHYYRGTFERYFYFDTGNAAEPKGQIPFPPAELWQVTLTGAPIRTTIDGHDYVTVAYHFESTILTSKDSPGLSVLSLGTIGGTYDEPEVWPVDPTLVFQHTGNACVDELEYPPGSWDAGNADKFYDWTCMGDADGSTPWCHIDPADENCVDSLDAHVGKYDVNVHFERLKWNKKTADAARVDIATANGADLVVRTDVLAEHRIRYHWIEPDSCEVIEGCYDVGATGGWVRVLELSSQNQNIGRAPLHMGSVQKTIDEGRNLYEFSECHGHNHLHDYGLFTFEDGSGNVLASRKQGFALESTNRNSNNEWTPWNNNYDNAAYQGIEAGHADLYQIGIPCQGVDVTTIDVSSGPVVGTITSTVNPEALMCEGLPHVDANGDVDQWEATSVLDDEGNVIQRPVCDHSGTPGWDLNNTGEVPATIPVAGEGVITEACVDGEIGPFRDCGLTYAGSFDCVAGAETTHQSVSSASLPVTRICERSAALGGTSCMYLEATAQESADSVTFTCPAQRDSATGAGGYSVYVGDAASIP